jgi:hypothetical protein
MLYDVPFIADWKQIGERKQQLTYLISACKYEGRINFDYQIGYLEAGARNKGERSGGSAIGKFWQGAQERTSSS